MEFCKKNVVNIIWLRECGKECGKGNVVRCRFFIQEIKFIDPQFYSCKHTKTSHWYAILKVPLGI